MEYATFNPFLRKTRRAFHFLSNQSISIHENISLTVQSFKFEDGKQPGVVK